MPADLKELGFESLDDFLVNFWEKFFLARDANNLLCMLSTWQNGNVGNTEGFDSSLEGALASIKVGRMICAEVGPEVVIPALHLSSTADLSCSHACLLAQICKSDAA